MRILLLSAYDAASHARWRQALQDGFPEHHWTQLTLPPRYFSWRIRGNSLTWAFSQRELLDGDYDLLIATSMVDLSSLRGFVPRLAQLPTLLYFHENQFAYPASGQAHQGVEPQIIGLYSALCADCLVFNSDFNRRSFLAGAEALLQRLPDGVPTGLNDVLRQRSRVLPVPLRDMPAPVSRPSADDCFQVVWNHRWEYDKGPERLLAMLEHFFAYLGVTPGSVIVHVVGQGFRQAPAAFTGIRDLLTEKNALGTWGYLASATDYGSLLHRCHLVLSTALHDFQGLAVLEAVAAGCVPLVPARQAYPEWFGEEYCYPGDLQNPAHEADAMANALHGRFVQYRAGQWPMAPDVTRFNWLSLRDDYECLLKALVKGGLPGQ